MADVVDGCYGDKLGHVTIVDCRYPYDYEGGHIKVSQETQYFIDFLLQIELWFLLKQLKFDSTIGLFITVVATIVTSRTY